MSVSETARGQSDQMEQITDHVVRIPLPLPVADLHTVNTYAICGDHGVTLIDPGWANDASETVLVTALGRLGYTAGDVSSILVTHAHWDHYTLAVKWQRERGVKVILGAGERHTIEAFAASEAHYPVQAGLLRRAGAPELADSVQELELQPHEQDKPFGPPDVWLDGGEELDCNGRTIIAHATPGHTRGHVVYDDPTDGLLFTGDHILPRITPSIGFERAPEPLPLRSYLASLQLFLALPDARMLPAHGAVADSVQSRARELTIHHEQRLELVRGLVSAGAETAYEVAGQMTWTRREQTLAELGVVHGMTAVLEVYAHLELLVTQGVIRCDASDSAHRYCDA